MTEEYKPIQDFENYEVSNLGNVRNKKSGIILRCSIGKDGYYKVSLYQDKIKYSKKIHKLLAQAFIENPENKPCVDHKNNNKLDNNIDNLRWATTKENGQNRKVNINSKTGIKGVYFDKKTNKYKSHIRIDGITIHLGCFDNIEDAKAARITKAQQVFGVYINSCEN